MVVMSMTRMTTTPKALPMSLPSPKPTMTPTQSSIST
uniref:Uncharacterized protein n=1 Tax=Arundo donax TaxID=35708 RepID=A0A0A9B5G0_ARUDO